MERGDEKRHKEQRERKVPDCVGRVFSKERPREAR